MSYASFIHLRAHTNYSLSEGAVNVNDLVDLAKKYKMPALGVTDSGNLFGALEFSLKAGQSGIQPIIGCTIGLATTNDLQPGMKHTDPDKIALIAVSEVGYKNLMTLSSNAFLNTEPSQTPNIPWSNLQEYSQGLLALTGGLNGPIGRLLIEGRYQVASDTLNKLAQIFPNRLYVEIQRHGIPDEDSIEPKLIQLAYEQKLPLVATNDVFFSNKEMHEAQDVLLCIAAGTFQSDDDRHKATPEHRFKSPEEMQHLFSDIPEAINNTLTIAKRCSYCCTDREPILPTFISEKGNSEEEELRLQSQKGLLSRFKSLDELDKNIYQKRLEHELDIIIKMGFSGYFLVVADFIRFAHKSNIPVGPGRGSGAGSVVAWALRITDLDPLRFGLLFERFLNPHRISMPDFDIDFCQERRDEVIQYVQRRYGSDRVAQIITFGTLQARAAIRDVGRVLEVPYGFVDRIAKMVPYNPASPLNLADAIAGEPRLQAEAENDERIAHTLDIAQKLEGLYRHASTHAAGVVIADRPLTDLVPLYRDPRSDMPVTQFSMKFVEAAGLVKFDFLGLKTLTIIDKAITLISGQNNQDLDINNLPLDDQKTYEMLSRGETVGVFQLESAGMRDLIKDVKPNGIEDVIAIVALYRPGPMENIPKYVACKHGREKPEHLHDLIEPVVRDTYGVIIYQEQVMQIAQIFAGFTMAEADILRRAMGKKIKSEMISLRDRFIAGAQSKGVSADRANYVFELVDKFAGYGFNKAHSAGYAIIAYQTAYLKAHYPVEFLAACMTVGMANTDTLAMYVQEAKKLNIPILPPDVNNSGVEFSVEMHNRAPAIRYALAAVRNVGSQAMLSLVREREQNGKFNSLSDFSARIDLRISNRRQIENLAKAGGFDCLHSNRAEVLGVVETILQHASSATQEREAGQPSLFGESTVNADRPFKIQKFEEFKSSELLRHEHESLGLYLSAHPMEAYSRILSNKKITSICNTADRVNKGATSLLIAGIVDRKQERRSAKGNRFAYVTISDTTDQVEVLVFSDRLSDNRDLLEPGNSVLLTVDVRQDRDTLRLSASKIESLDAFSAKQPVALDIVVADAGVIKDLEKTLNQARDGKVQVSVVVRPLNKNQEVQVALPGSYGVTPLVKETLARTPGVLELREN